MGGRNGYFEPRQPLRWMAVSSSSAATASSATTRVRVGLRVRLPFPLNVFNVFTDRPMWLWMAIALLQALVGVPLMVRRWGKGGFCGWVCPAARWPRPWATFTARRCRTARWPTG